VVVEPVDGGFVPSWQPLPVRVDREFDACVSELALHVLGTLALLKKQRGVAMAKAMGRVVERKPRGPEDPPERATDVCLVEQPS
jgi:hypothetical protein